MGERCICQDYQQTLEDRNICSYHHYLSDSTDETGTSAHTCQNDQQLQLSVNKINSKSDRSSSLILIYY